MVANPGPLLGFMAGMARDSAGVVTTSHETDDIVWHYLDGGSGEPVLMLHGFGSDKDSLVSLAIALKGKYRTILVDLPGFGESSQGLSLNYTIDDQIGRVAGLCRALDLPAAHLVGHAYGASLAAGFAAEHPQRVRSLFMMVPAGITPKGPALVQELYDNDLTTYDSILLYRNRQEFEELMTHIFPAGLPMPGFVIDHIVEREVGKRDLRRKILVDGLRGKGADFLEAYLQRIRVPTLVIWGADDTFEDPGCAERLQVLLPTAQSMTFEACGHVPFVDQSQKTNEAYLRFLAKL